VGRRVVIVGGGWGGLTAARHLRRLVPGLEVLLIDRDAAFRSLPLSNSWLVGRTPDAPLQQDYATAARAWGYRAIRADVTAIDRERRRLHTAQGALGYDWLILAAGIRHDYGPWLGGDARAIEATRRLYPAGFLANEELDALKQNLADFRGGDLLMTVPPPPPALPAGALRARGDDRLAAEDAPHQGPPGAGRCRRRHAALQSHVRRALQGADPAPDPRPR
jgi:NADPH-dependent 2,4-dienoyl-CoA reductase/sulfur reductase-like enzyme